MYQRVGMITNSRHHSPQYEIWCVKVIRIIRMELSLHRDAHGQTFTKPVDCFTL